MALGCCGGLNPTGGPDGGKDRSQLGQVLFVRPPQAAHVLAGDVLIERVDEQGVGEVALELAGPAAQDNMPPLQRSGVELGQQSRLADSRLATEAERTRVALFGLVEGALHQTKLLAASNQSGFHDSHEPSVAARRAGLWPPGRRRIAKIPVVQAPIGGTQ